MRRALLVIITAIASITAIACTTDVGLGDPVSFQSSRLLGTNSNVVTGISTTDDAVIWFDSAGNLFSCPKAGCDGKAKVLTTSTGAPAPYFGSFGFSSRLPAVIAGGSVYWISAASIRRCSLNGCPAGPDVVYQGVEGLLSLTTDGTTLAWNTQRGVGICNASDCKPRALGCAEDSECPANAPVCFANQCTVCQPFGAKGACKASAGSCGSDATCVACEPQSTTSFGASGAIACSGSATPMCDPKTRTCVRCLSTADCSVGSNTAQACAGNVCTDCDGDYGSGTAKSCSVALPFCNAQKVCAACNPTDCVAPNECVSAGLGQAVCALPCPGGQADCSSRQVCASGYCVPKLPEGTACIAADRCISGACAAGRCGNANSAACAVDTDCVTGVCGSDKKCGAAEDGPCAVAEQCRTGTTCRARKCVKLGTSPQTGPQQLGSATIVLAGGRLYYSQVDTSRAYSVSIMSCAVADCPNGVTRLPTPPDVSAILLAGDARSLFYKVSASSGAQAGALFRCDLPGCTTPIDMGGQAEQEIVIMGEDVFVPAAQFQSSYYVCTRARCSTNLLATPEPELQSGPFASRPFAVDATTIYWATTTIFDNPGNLVLATPRK